MAYPTDRLLFFRTDSSSGGDGTEDRTDGTTRAFASLSAALDYVRANDTDLTGQGVLTLRTTVGSQTADTVFANTISIVTTASDYLVIEATGDARCNGVSKENGGTGYQLKRGGDCLFIDSDYTRVKGIEFTTTTVNKGSIEQSSPGGATSDVYIDECMCTTTVATESSTPLISSDGGVMTITNTLVIANGARGIELRLGNGATLDHCGVVGTASGADGMRYGILVDSNTTATNTYALNATSDGEDWFGELGSGNNNASEDGSASGTSEATVTTLTDEFTTFSGDPASADLTLKNTGELFDNGSGGSSIDITGATRTGTSIGPFDYAAAVGTTIEVPTGPWR